MPTKTLVKVKDLAELKASIAAKIEAWRKKGRDEEAALQMAQDYLDEHEFEDAEGAELQMDLNALKAKSADITSDAGVIAKAVSDALKPLIDGLGEIKGRKPGNITVKEPWENILNGEDKTWGFKNIGDFSIAVFNANHPVRNKQRTDDRLALISKASQAVENGLYKATPTTYASELVGADGGFLVPPQYREEVWIAVNNNSSFLQFIDLTPTGQSNTVNMNVDQNAPWDNTSGIAVGWRQQATTMSQSKPIFQNRQITLNEMYALVPATDEMLADGPMLNNYLSIKAPEKMAYAIDDSIFRGTGQGQPLGFLGHNATQIVTANSTVSGFSVTDISNMYPRLLSGTNMAAPMGCWLMAKKTYAYVITLGTGSNAGFPLALTNQTIEGKVLLTMLGMPIYPTEHCNGTDKQGDLILANLKGYLGFNKSDGFDFQSSIHLFFDSGATALRWRFRFGGEPALRSGITSANDTANIMSHFVVLGGRNGN